MGNAAAAAAAPAEGSRLNHDMQTWERAEARLKQDEYLVKQLCAMIGSVSNPLNVARLIMMQMTNVSGDQIEGLSAASNVDTDIRNQVMGGQTDFNSGGKMTKKQAEQMYQALNKLKAWLEHEKSLGDKSIISPDAINNILGAIKGIATQFGKGWGNATDMAADMSAWEKKAKDGKDAPELKDIQNQFQTINQSVSAFATTTNTELQYQTEEYKQYLGEFNDVNQTYLKLIGTMVRNQKPVK